MKKREIKFRGFSADSNKWIYGYLNKPFDDVTQIIEKIPSNASQMSLVVNGSEGQFTGLIDKNGRNIYEGDIISYREHIKYLQSSFIGEVTWLDSHCAFGYVFNDKNIIKTYPFNSIDEIQNDFLNHTEVIGNIYQNSDIIKNEK